MVPFLEQLDRQGVTRRVGDRRTVMHNWSVGDANTVSPR
jgi:hypothetical protein